MTQTWSKSVLYNMITDPERDLVVCSCINVDPQGSLVQARLRPAAGKPEPFPGLSQALANRVNTPEFLYITSFVESDDGVLTVEVLTDVSSQGE